MRLSGLPLTPSSWAVKRHCSSFGVGVKGRDPRVIQLAKDHPDYKTKCIPYVIHGDGVPCTKNHTLDCISFESLVAKKTRGDVYSTLDYIFFVTGAFTQTFADASDRGWGKAKIRLWEPVVHSLRALYYGRWPDTDPCGQEYMEQASDNYFKKGSKWQEAFA